MWASTGVIRKGAASRQMPNPAERRRKPKAIPHLPMLWGYGQQKYLYCHSAGIDFSCQNLTYTNVRF